MNTYLGATLQQPQLTDQMVLHGSASTLLGGAANCIEEDGLFHQAPHPVEDPLTAAEYLSPTQEEYFLNLFWNSYHTSLFPILNEAEFMDHYQSLWTASGNSTRKPSALVDIVIALCMQYGVSKLPTQRQKPIIAGDASVAGRWYFRRCQMLAAYQLENPTISTV